MVQATRLLLVEDDDFDAEVVHRALKRSHEMQYDVYAARSLADAFKQLCEASYDVVLLDLGLPDGLGLNGLKKMVRMLEAPVIVLTGNDNQRLIDEAMLLGAHDFVPKSENLSVVLEKTIRFAIQRYQALVALTNTEGLLTAHHEFSRSSLLVFKRSLMLRTSWQHLP
ncbi:MAG: response regulator [Fuerstiella sp.]